MRNAKTLNALDIKRALREALTEAKPVPARRLPLTGATLASVRAARLARVDTLLNASRDLLAGTKDGGRQERLRATVERLEALRARLATRVGHKHAFAGCRVHIEALEERKLKITRTLTMQERRIDFEALNERFNRIQAELEDEMEDVTSEEIERAMKTVQNKLDSGDIAAIAGLTFLFRGKIRDLLNRTVKNSYDVGKVMAAKELGLAGRPPTPLADTQFMNFDSVEIADAYADALEAAAVGAAKEGLSVGASTEAIVGSVRNRVNDEASRAIVNTSGSVVGQYVNRGRNTVFASNASKIVAYQRSEVLDDATCNVCLSLDERVIDPDDPARYLEIVHTHCRGLWVPILSVDDEQPEVTDIPKSIMDTFDTIEGKPVLNAFKQIKKPINDVSKAAQAQIRKRLEDKGKKS